MSEAEPAERQLPKHEELNVILDEIFERRNVDPEVDSPPLLALEVERQVDSGSRRVFGVFGSDTYFGKSVGNHYVGLAQREYPLVPNSQVYYLEAHPFDKSKESVMIEYHPSWKSAVVTTYTEGSEPQVKRGLGVGLSEMMEFAFEIIEAQKSNRLDVAVARLDGVEREDIKFELLPLAA